MTRTGYVAEAAIEVLATRLSSAIPGLDMAEARRITRRQVEELVRDGFRITVPVTVVAAPRRGRPPRTT
ncbi:hypothetical protein ACFYQA_17430 [Streptomyces sp. NPDC005774]|uniref:hypothetical protein n=1 Tax=Streptomyces sp. NPDC005774 TaxID=3364728 RepID=UPI0036A3FCF3